MRLDNEGQRKNLLIAANIAARTLMVDASEESMHNAMACVVLRRDIEAATIKITDNEVGDTLSKEMRDAES